MPRGARTSSFRNRSSLACLLLCSLALIVVDVGCRCLLWGGCHGCNGKMLLRMFVLCICFFLLVCVVSFFFPWINLVKRAKVNTKGMSFKLKIPSRAAVTLVYVFNNVNYVDFESTAIGHIIALTPEMSWLWTISKVIIGYRLSQLLISRELNQISMTCIHFRCLAAEFQWCSSYLTGYLRDITTESLHEHHTFLSSEDMWGAFPEIYCTDLLILLISD